MRCGVENIANGRAGGEQLVNWPWRWLPSRMLRPEKAVDGSLPEFRGSRGGNAFGLAPIMDFSMSTSLPSLPSAAPQICTEYPRRIVCLTDETTETLYLLGEQDRIVGVSGYAHRPPEARRKPRVSAFRDANFEAILDLKPDLILTFSDVQAEITR